MPASAPVDSPVLGIGVAVSVKELVAPHGEVAEVVEARLKLLVVLTLSVAVLVVGTVSYAVSELTHVALVAIMLGRIWKRPTPESQQLSVWSQQ